MKSFADSTGRAWRITINLPHAQRVFDVLKIDLLDVDVYKTLRRVALSAYELANIAYVLCENQAQAAGIDNERFAEAMSGESFQSAYEAIEGALLDFFPEQNEPDGDAKAQAQTPINVWKLCYEIAGRIGIDPGSLTLRQLGWMCEARDQSAWQHTSSVLAATINYSANHPKRPVNPVDLNPMTAPQKPLRGSWDMFLAKFAGVVQKPAAAHQDS